MKHSRIALLISLQGPRPRREYINHILRWIAEDTNLKGTGEINLIRPEYEGWEGPEPVKGNWSISANEYEVSPEIPADELAKFREWQKRYQELKDKFLTGIIGGIEFALRAHEFGFTNVEIEAEMKALHEQKSPVAHTHAG